MGHHVGLILDHQNEMESNFGGRLEVSLEGDDVLARLGQKVRCEVERRAPNFQAQ